MNKKSKYHIHHKIIFTKPPVINENRITNNIYIKKFFTPRAIFKAPRFVIFVAGPVIIKEAAEPALIQIGRASCRERV